MAMKWMITSVLVFGATSAFARSGDFLCTTVSANGRVGLTHPELIQEVLNLKCDKTKPFSTTPFTGAESMMVCCVEK